MNLQTDKGLRLCRQSVQCSILSVVLLGVSSAGCAHSIRSNREVAALGEPIVRKAPAFLTSPLTALLTNTASGFAGQAAMVSRPSPNRVELASGELMGRGTKLLFVPDDARSSGKRRHGSGMIFLWDVSENSGYVLSEALQGYASIASAAQGIHLRVKPRAGNPPLEKIDGHPCELMEVIVSSRDETTTELRVWAATDLNQFPLRIASTTNSTLPSLSLSHLKLEAPPLEAFLPPAWFTKYDNAEAMMSELMARQQRVVRRPAGPTGPLEHGEDSDRPRSRIGY